MVKAHYQGYSSSNAAIQRLMENGQPYCQQTFEIKTDIQGLHLSYMPQVPFHNAFCLQLLSQGKGLSPSYSFFAMLALQGLVIFPLPLKELLSASV